MSKHLLTKSAFRFGLACDRYFWIYQNARESLPEVDESTQAIFDQGHLIGNLAKTLYRVEPKSTGVQGIRQGSPKRKLLLMKESQYLKPDSRTA